MLLTLKSNQSMNRIYTLMLVLCLAIAGSTAWAESINENQARRIAEGFMTSHRLPATGLKLAKKAPQLNAPSQAGKAAYYVFNNGQTQGGYIIVAGDDHAPAVLGYSDRGTFDAQAVPEAMQELLDSYAEQIEAISLGNKAAALTSSGPAIAPMLTSCWNQKSPHNHLLPFVEGNRAVVGCAATAMAQIMYYWKWPARPTMTIPEYTTTTYSIFMPALEPVDFNWDAMQDNYLGSDTLSEAGLATATLSLYCAQSLEMDFEDGTSGAVTSRAAQKLSTYFGYKGSAHTLCRLNYTTQEWSDMLYSELSAHRPVIYSGRKKSSGHAFICDGYDGNGMFHINWGWNGQSNGYFLLNVLNPDMQGTGSASGVYGYVYSQAAIVGIEPGESPNDFAMTITSATLNSATTTRTDTNENFTAVLTGLFHNYTSEVIAARFGWGLYQDDQFIERLYSTSTSGVKPGNYFTIADKTVSFGSGNTSGTYRIVPIYSEYGESNWRPCYGGDKHYFEVTINGNECTFKGYGSASEINYTVNDITMEGMMHNGRPVDLNVNLTNNGEWSNRLLYMFVDGAFKATGLVNLGNGETADIPFRFMPSAAGEFTLTWSWNDDGSDPIATRTVTINPMPSASLSGTLQVLNVTDATNKIVTSDKFCVELTVTNNGTETYNEELSFKLYKHSTGNSGTSVQGINMPIVLEPGETKTVQADFDNVVNGWKYFVNSYYYSAGEQIKIKGTSFHTIVFPEAPVYETGDVNGDGKVSIKDVTDLINYLLSENSEGIILDNADVNSDGKVSIKDVTDLINLLLSHQ